MKILLECTDMGGLQRRADVLIGRAIELLTQPEQEPVGIVRTIGGYPDDSVHTVELTCRYGALKDGDKIYTAPPKREPLSDEEIDLSTNGMSEFGSDMFKAGIKAAERSHGIGGEE